MGRRRMDECIEKRAVFRQSRRIVELGDFFPKKSYHSYLQIEGFIVSPVKPHFVSTGRCSRVRLN